MLALLAGISSSIPVPYCGEVLAVSTWLRNALIAVQSVVFSVSYGTLFSKWAHSVVSKDFIAPIGFVILLHSASGVLRFLVYWTLSLEKMREVPDERLVGIGLQIPAVLLLCGVVLYLKFGLKGCSLNNSADNQWGFGQYLVIVMTFAPFLSLLEDFLSMSYLVRIS